MKLKARLLFAAVLLVVVALPLAAAAQVTDPLDLLAIDASGEGWEWKAGTKTLTLSGIDLKVATDDSDEYAVNLPAGATIILEEGTENFIENSVGGGIYAEGDLEITGEGSGKISILTKGYSIWSDGDVNVSDCGSVSIQSDGTEDGGGIIAGASGSYSPASVRISDCGQFSIKTECGQGLWAKTNISISGCGTVSIDSSGDGMDADYSISISGCDEVAVSSADGGIISSDDVMISNCGEMTVSSVDTSIHSGSEISICNCILEAVSSEDTCIYSSGGISIWGGSRLTACGTDFAIFAEGRIAIVEGSYVLARCDAEEGLAAIFAEEDNAIIELGDCVVLAPEGAKIVDVAIPSGGSGGYYCQSVSAGPGIATISDWSQAAKEVIIGPEGFSVTFDSQGGSSIPTIWPPGGSTIAAPPAPTRAGYTFGGWYRDASCSESWDFGSDKVEGNITLYAKWNLVAPEVEEPEKEEPKGEIPGELPVTAGNGTVQAAALLILLGGLLLLYRRFGEYA